MQLAAEVGHTQKPWLAMGHMLRGREGKDFPCLLQRHQKTMACDLDRQPVASGRVLSHSLQTLCQPMLQGPEGFFIGHL